MTFFYGRRRVFALLNYPDNSTQTVIQRRKVSAHLKVIIELLSSGLTCLSFALIYLIGRYHKR